MTKQSSPPEAKYGLSFNGQNATAFTPFKCPSNVNWEFDILKDQIFIFLSEDALANIWLSFGLMANFITKSLCSSYALTNLNFFDASYKWIVLSSDDVRNKGNVKWQTILLIKSLWASNSVIFSIVL